VARTSYATISRADIAERYAFLYCIHALVPTDIKSTSKAMYIGQTRNRFGAIGRLTQHLSNDDTCNTFKQRIGAIFNTGDKLTDISFIACPLSPLKSFLVDSPDYREAVEALVQDKVIQSIVKQNLKVVVVSRISYNAYTRERFIQEEADAISREILTWIHDVCSN